MLSTPVPVKKLLLFVAVDASDPQVPTACEIPLKNSERTVSAPPKLRSKTAPVVRSTSAASARESVGLVMLNVPACTVVLPEYVLAPVSLSEPTPVLVIED